MMATEAQPPIEPRKKSPRKKDPPAEVPPDLDTPERFHPLGMETPVSIPTKEIQIQRGLTNRAFQKGVAWRNEVIGAIVGARRKGWSERKIHAYLTWLGVTPERINLLYKAADELEDFIRNPE